MTTTNDAPAPAPSGSGVRVKALEWIGYPNSWPVRAQTDLGDYCIVYDGRSVEAALGWRVWSTGEMPETPAGSYEEAQALAEADLLARILSVLASDASPRGEAFQQRVQPWMLACFGEEISRDVVERNHRFLEEALELVQSTGCTASEAHQLVDYVFGREIGETHQEIGGVMVTLAALCLALGEDMHTAGETELARIWTKVEKIRAKQAAKPKHSPLPQHAPAHPAPATVESDETTKIALGHFKTTTDRAQQITKLTEALQTAEPFVELLHSLTGEKRARAIVWKALKQVRAALAPATEGRKG